jgi:hypothetical protein
LALLCLRAGPPALLVRALDKIALEGLRESQLRPLEVAESAVVDRGRRRHLRAEVTEDDIDGLVSPLGGLPCGDGIVFS